MIIDIKQLFNEFNPRHMRKLISCSVEPLILLPCRAREKNAVDKRENRTRMETVVIFSKFVHPCLLLLSLLCHSYFTLVYML